MHLSSLEAKLCWIFTRRIWRSEGTSASSVQDKVWAIETAAPPTVSEITTIWWRWSKLMKKSRNSPRAWWSLTCARRSKAKNAIGTSSASGPRTAGSGLSRYLLACTTTWLRSASTTQSALSKSNTFSIRLRWLASSAQPITPTRLSRWRRRGW